MTKPGGVVAACVWDHNGGLGPFAAFWSAARDLDPGVDDESGRAGTREGQLVELCAAAGLDAIESSMLTVHRPYESFDEWWEPFTYGIGPAGEYVADLDDARREALRERCRGVCPGGAVRDRGVSMGSPRARLTLGRSAVSRCQRGAQIDVEHAAEKRHQLGALSGLEGGDLDDIPGEREADDL